MFRVVLGEHDRSSVSGHEVIVGISRIIVVSECTPLARLYILTLYFCIIISCIISTPSLD